MRAIRSLLVIAVLMTGAAQASEPWHYVIANTKPLDWPKIGTPYDEARAHLLAQGLAVAPRGKGYPAQVFPECYAQTDRFDGKTAYCRALFLQTSQTGWRHFVVVDVALDNKTVLRADYPAPVEGLPAIPPPLAKDVPPLKGPYFSARQWLRAQGFVPAKTTDKGALHHVCADAVCRHMVRLPEANCAGSGLGECIADWIAPDGRVLKVTTIGDVPEIYYVEWLGRKEQAREGHQTTHTR